MIQIVLAINQQDCTIGDGNTAEEYEAIAVTLLRAAEAIRNQEGHAGMHWAGWQSTGVGPRACLRSHL